MLTLLTICDLRSHIHNLLINVCIIYLDVMTETRKHIRRADPPSRSQSEKNSFSDCTVSQSTSIRTELMHVDVSSDLFCRLCFQTPVTLCSLGVGATFGDSILHDLPRDSTVVTRSTCELLRVERQDFKLIWEVSHTLQLAS